MSTTAVVWLRRELRVHDSPALWNAHQQHDHVAVLFVIDPTLFKGRFSSGTRSWFMLQSLRLLREDIRQRGGELYVRAGEDPVQVALSFTQELDATSIYWSSDATPYALSRDRRLISLAQQQGIEANPSPGNFIADISKPRTKTGKPWTVFTPFWRSWLELPRRELLPAPEAISRPPLDIAAGEIPELESFGLKLEVSQPPPPGEAAARKLMQQWFSGEVDHYAESHDRLAGGTSLLSPYLRFGCISPLELESRAKRHGGSGAEAFSRQLAWREFYAHVLLNNPNTRTEEFQPRYRSLKWLENSELLQRWCAGETGYPLVDAGMRQLLATGWMHNRTRMVVGSFLTKDLHINWRAGEQHFMRYLIDGEIANNNGNWQWIASVGVDPAPYFRRLFNPTLQQQRFDPEGDYVKLWVPELAQVPTKYLAEPWRMPLEIQQQAGCIIGEDYPHPIVDHATERKVAIERYRAVSESTS